MEFIASIQSGREVLPLALGVFGLDENDRSRQEKAEGLFQDDGPRDIQVKHDLGADQEPSLEPEGCLLGADGADLGPFLEFPAHRVQAGHSGWEREIEGPLPFPGPESAL